MPGIVTVTSPASSSALTTLEAAKLELNLTDPTDDVFLNRLINRASGVISKHCGRTFGKESLSETFRHSHYGIGMAYPYAWTYPDPHHRHHHRPLVLSRVPVVAITSVTVDGTVLAPNEYDVDAESGLVWRLFDGHRIHWTGLNITVNYVAGYTLPQDTVTANAINWTVNGAYDDGSTISGTFVTMNGEISSPSVKTTKDTYTATVSPWAGITSGLSSFSSAISDDGSTIVGTISFPSDPNTATAFRWKAGEAGWITLIANNPQSEALAVNSDGSVVVGDYIRPSDSFRQAFRWTAATGAVDIAVTSGGSDARVISSDGSIVYGNDKTNGSVYRWTSTGGTVNLNFNGTPVGCNYDGSILIGYNDDDGLFRWTGDGYQSFGKPQGLPGSFVVFGVSRDGTVAIGRYNNNSFRWSEAGGFVYLPVPAGASSVDTYACNEDGTIIVGDISDTDGNMSAAMWSETGGWQKLGQYDPTYAEVIAVSANGLYAAGDGTDFNTNGVIFRWNLSDLRGVASDVLDFRFGFSAGSVSADRMIVESDGSTVRTTTSGAITGIAVSDIPALPNDVEDACLQLVRAAYMQRGADPTVQYELVENVGRIQYLQNRPAASMAIDDALAAQLSPYVSRVF